MKKRISQIHFASLTSASHLASLVVTLGTALALTSCNYKVSKSDAVDGASFGFGTGSAAETKALGILATNCASCHGSANGMGGVSEITSPQALLNAGLVVPGNAASSPIFSAVSSGRMPPSGAIAAADVSALKDWINGAGAGAGPLPTNEPLAMIERNSPALYFGDGKPVTVFWDLSTADALPATARFPALFVMDVKVDYQMVSGKSLPTGYQFSNPRIQMLTGELEVEVSGIVVRVNGNQPSGTENFLSAHGVAKGIDPINIFNGSVTVALPAVSDADRISVAFTALTVRARSDNPPVPGTPTLASSVNFTAAAQFGITVGNDSAARRWCLTASSAVPTSTAAACPGFEGMTTTTGWLGARPTNFDLASLGRPIQPNETIKFYVWVANSDLKISRAPGQAQVVFDNIAAPSPVFSSISVTDTQIADIVGLQDNSEAVSWCAVEDASMMNVKTAGSCQFQAAKPAYVGLKGGGTRYIAVFAKDRAGNLSTSAIATANNPFGRLSFAQLTDAANGSRAVFANRCVSCHGAGAANQATWDSSSYADTVAKKTKILTRIDSASSPMPTTGLLNEKERALIRLWFSQTSTPVQL